jgi:hypothetical protein
MDMGYFERALISNGYFERTLISNGYFEGAVTSKIPTKVLGFHNIQNAILLIRITLIYKMARS